MKQLHFTHRYLVWRRIVVGLWIWIAVAAPFSPLVQAATLATPVPSVSLSVPTETFIGANFSFTATFDNTAVTDTGYGPFVDLVLPYNGADGAAGTATADGISFVNATYLGQTVTATQLTFPAGTAPTCVNHPYAVNTSGTALQVCGTPGDKLVVLQLPFGSFTVAQPPAALTVNASLSNLADVGTSLAIKARAGFQFGSDALNNPATDPSVVSSTNTNSATWTVSASTRPTLLTLTKSYLGPENETATGPNYPRQYRVTATVASGQTVTNLDLTDLLPSNLQYVGLDATSMNGGAVSTTAILTPSLSTPGGTLTRRFATVTNSAEMLFTYYVPLNNGAGAPVINASNGDDATSVDDAKVQADWTPVDARDAAAVVTSDVTANDHTLTDMSIAIQKSVSVLTDVGAPGTSPGDTLRYTLNFQISDFFAFQNVVLTDLISDGQRYDSGFTPTLQVNGNGFTLAAGSMNGSNFTVQPNYTPADPAPNDGTTTLTFRVSNELVSRGRANGRWIGGCVPVAGTGGGTPDCAAYNDAATTGTLIFRTVVQKAFSDTYPSGDPSVDEGDLLTNNVTAAGADQPGQQRHGPGGRRSDGPLQFRHCHRCRAPTDLDQKLCPGPGSGRQHRPGHPGDAEYGQQ